MSRGDPKATAEHFYSDAPRGVFLHLGRGRTLGETYYTKVFFEGNGYNYKSLLGNAMST